MPPYSWILVSVLSPPSPMRPRQYILMLISKLLKTFKNISFVSFSQNYFLGPIPRVIQPALKGWIYSPQSTINFRYVLLFPINLWNISPMFFRRQCSHRLLLFECNLITIFNISQKWYIRQRSSQLSLQNYRSFFYLLQRRIVDARNSSI